MIGPFPFEIVSVVFAGSDLLHVNVESLRPCCAPTGSAATSEHERDGTSETQHEDDRDTSGYFNYNSDSPNAANV